MPASEYSCKDQLRLPLSCLYMMDPPQRNILKTVDANVVTPPKRLSPTKRRKRLSLALKRRKLSPKSRFQLVEPKKLSQMEKGYVPPNTAKCTGWTVKNFDAWREERNRSVDDKEV